MKNDRSPQRTRKYYLAVSRMQDILAEALIVHPHHCVVRQTALAILDEAGLGEVEFMTRWAAGDLGE